MWLMLQQKSADDYVIATGETHSVREFAETVFNILGLDWKKHVEIDERYMRPSEVDLLLGDPSKARTELGWRPRVKFAELAKMMTEHDWALAREERVLTEHRAKNPAH
jgi:GDPmannose 4,6-dehydratase